jgi:hypothetical protein
MESETGYGVETSQQELKAEHQQTLSSPSEEEVRLVNNHRLPKRALKPASRLEA